MNSISLINVCLNTVKKYYNNNFTNTISSTIINLILQSKIKNSKTNGLKYLTNINLSNIRDFNKKYKQEKYNFKIFDNINYYTLIKNKSTIEKNVLEKDLNPDVQIILRYEIINDYPNIIEFYQKLIPVTLSYINIERILFFKNRNIDIVEDNILLYINCMFDILEILHANPIYYKDEEPYIILNIALIEKFLNNF